ncbi:MAG: transglutaminase [Alkalinema sp. CACIAM 70d]|nr:MAG: transglutaminase [Alkalinema sp. CACIAM 70d]
MHYRISHTTVYQYSKPVTLQPHLLRLRPRSDGWQTLLDFHLSVSPEPKAISSITDLDGNGLIKLWFDPSQSAEQLTITTQSHVATHQSNPFVYLLEPWAIELPFDYPKSLWSQLQPYLGRAEGQASLDPVAVELAQEIDEASNGNVAQFLNELNQRIYTECQYTLRETGHPFAAGVTWREKKGSCRDFAVLFMEVCRSVGLAARFVSGYQEGDPDSNDRHLHAWAEVYLPGAGWRGYDPTHGLVISDRHIALVASAIPTYTSPVSGRIHRPGGVQSELTYKLKIDVSETAQGFEP